MPESGITLIWPYFSLSFCVCPSIFHRVVKIAIYFVFSVREKIENCQRKCYGDFFHASKYFSLKGIEDKIWKQIKLQNLSKDNKTMFKYSKVIKRLQIFCLSWTDIFLLETFFPWLFVIKIKDSRSNINLSIILSLFSNFYLDLKETEKNEIGQIL